MTRQTKEGQDEAASSSSVLLNICSANVEVDAWPNTFSDSKAVYNVLSHASIFRGTDMTGDKRHLLIFCLL